MKTRIRQWAREITRDVHALHLAVRDPRVPWYARVAALSVAAYAFSPIDLIPDFIPVIGYVDDLVIVPLGILLAAKLVPLELMREFRTVASAGEGTRSLGRYGAVFIVLLWIAGLISVARWVPSWWTP